MIQFLLTIKAVVKYHAYFTGQSFVLLLSCAL